MSTEIKLVLKSVSRPQIAAGGTMHEFTGDPVCLVMQVIHDHRVIVTELAAGVIDQRHCLAITDLIMSGAKIIVDESVR